ncbi:MAG: hypothetical protein HQL87_03650 [Magnetococcales bacterium]|nr:hypothetical protein [Magnetococcales bacterium]
MRWEKLGQLYCPQQIHPKLMSHAANPLPVLLRDDLYRVFFSGRDEQNRSSVGFADIDIVQQKVMAVHHQPIFEHGPKGSFYSHGVSIGNSYEAGGIRYILFMGWQIPDDGHWRGDVGRLCLAADCCTMSLDRAKPFIGTDSIDPISLSYPWVLRDGESYRMWYGSTMTWVAENNEMVHVIQSAHSRDGHHWVKDGLAVPYELGIAQAFSRPSVICDADGYHMWFSYRGGQPDKTYRIGYAFSECGKRWTLRLDDTGIDVAESGWDAEMIEYPFVLDHKGHRYMLYNGNGYGKTGFGLAVLAHG